LKHQVALYLSYQFQTHFNSSTLQQRSDHHAPAGKNELFFDTVFQHGSGQLLVIELHPIPNHIAATAHPLDINKLQTMVGPLILKLWPLLCPNMVSKPRTHSSVPVLTVQSAKPKI
jgi:hypothetical protein